MGKKGKGKGKSKSKERKKIRSRKEEEQQEEDLEQLLQERNRKNVKRSREKDIEILVTTLCTPIEKKKK